MNVLNGVVVLLCIDLVAANGPLHLMAMVWLDGGPICNNITDELRNLEHQIVTFWLNETTYDPKQCGCTKSMSKCPNENVNRTQLTLSYQLDSTSFDTNKLNKIFKLPTTFNTNRTHYFVCGEFRQFPTTNSGNLACETLKTTGTPNTTESHETKLSPLRQHSTTNEPSSSGPSTGTIIGTSLGALALLATLATIYPVYRRLKRQAQVDPDKDITPIVPADFGISDAPNSVAPAGV